MAKKKVAKKSRVPRSLEDPVNNYIGYGVLLVLAIVVFWLVQSMMATQ